jgi:sulfate permease, SulP family
VQQQTAQEVPPTHVGSHCGGHRLAGSFLHNVGAIARGLSDVLMPTLAVGLLTMAGLAAIERPKPRWPAPLIVIAAAITGVGLLGWQRHGPS